MSTRDFEYKQIAFVFTDEGEKISFKNDNLVVTDADGKVKHQSTCYRLFILFICGDYCLTTGLLDRSKKVWLFDCFYDSKFTSDFNDSI